MADQQAPKNYQAAQDELETLLAELQGPVVDVDKLAERVRRAKFILDWSRAKLRATEAEVEGLLDDAS